MHVRTPLAAGCCAAAICLLLNSVTLASPFELMTGVDVQRYPGSIRFVTPLPGGGTPRPMFDGDRLAGSADTGPPVSFQGTGTPLFPTNHVGAMSFIFRRGNIPFYGPFMGIEFLGGPLLDLDGDLNNGVRRLTPIPNTTPVVIPGTYSFIDLTLDVTGGTATVNNLDATGTNEAGPNIQAAIATTVSTIAGTTPTAGQVGPTNPGFDTRSGDITLFTGTGGGLNGVYRIDNLQFEFWNDSIDPNSGTASTLGTLQQFVIARGWYVRRDCQTGQFPTLSGQGLGSTRWPDIDTAHVGQIYNTAHGLAGGMAIISDGVPPNDIYSMNPNGVALAGGDLGAYLDTVVVPRVAASSPGFVYLESAGFGINNSGDPVFGDTNGWDLVIVAQERTAAGDLDGDGDVDDADRLLFVQALIDPSSVDACVRARADVNGDGASDGSDVQAFLAELY
ncbi:MAG: hypothetical protein HUU22_12665 [Phycisphaerae bacterium]|nr:hypothetical protein [Phycisphaerae bacterium]NUQ46870.1 hypothetical protein [Phycisphaerae bacterium]